MLSRSLLHVALRGASRTRSGLNASSVRLLAAQAKFRESPLKAEGRGEIVVITSGKGGVGKTTSAASFGAGLASKGFRTCLIDFDIGLRNLDIHLGMERRVVYDFVNCIQDECRLNQALIRDRREENLYLLAASQTRDKSVLTEEGVWKVLNELCEEFDYVVCDSPAGIETGAMHAMYFADSALICTNPELSSVRDSDRMIGLVQSKSKRAVEGKPPVKQHLVITRYHPEKVQTDQMISIDDIEEMLALPLIGVIPESEDVLKCSNIGQPVIYSPGSDAGECYDDLVQRFLGVDQEFRHIDVKPKSFLSRLFG